MKRLLLLTVILIAATSIASAATACVSGTLASLISDGSCQSQGLIFSGFTLSGTSLSSSSIVATLQAYQTGDGTYADNWTFTRNGGPFSSSFTLSYTVQVASGNSLGVNKIYQTQDQFKGGSIPGSTNLVTATDTETVGAITENTVSLDALSDAGETKSTPEYSLDSFSTSTFVHIPGKSVLYYSQTFYSNAPEPVTFLLIGSGLIGLTFLHRKIRKS